MCSTYFENNCIYNFAKDSKPVHLLEIFYIGLIFVNHVHFFQLSSYLPPNI